VATDICTMSAVEMARLVRAKEVSARELLAAHLTQIERVNPKVNAIVTLVADRALEQARAADEAQARGQAIGPLHGLPIAHKDLQLTRGIRTTFGSPIYRDFVPARTRCCRTRAQRRRDRDREDEYAGVRRRVADVQPGVRRHAEPIRPDENLRRQQRRRRGCAACEMLPLADGSDKGGSLRNPASFCGVVGCAPRPGDVPVWPSDDGMGRR
jgi:amidase